MEIAFLSIGLEFFDLVLLARGDSEPSLEPMISEEDSTTVAVWVTLVSARVDEMSAPVAEMKAYEPRERVSTNVMELTPDAFEE